MAGVLLLLLHPALAVRDCRHCQVYQYNDGPGGDRRPTLWRGRPLKRAIGTFPPCRYPDVGCPKGTPERQRVLTPQNAAAYLHWQECEAVGRFPDDRIVRRNARLIRSVVDRVKDEQQDQRAAALLAALGAGGGRH